MATIDIEVTASKDIPPSEVQAARERLAKLERYTDLPILAARLTLRHPQTHTSRMQYVADASMVVDGRLIAAHATGRSPTAAADEVADRLRRQLTRISDADVALRNEPRVIRKALEDLEHDRDHRPEARLKPPEARQIVRRRTYAEEPEPTYTAIADMLDLDEEFHLFRHARTGEDVVVYRRDDGRIGLIHPPGSALADESDDVVVAEPSRYSEPLSLDTARAEMDMLDHRFLYFIDAADGRGKVLYLRHDGDYGLVEPE
jgi:ribosome-associated translation inhibitor RaiA